MTNEEAKVLVWATIYDWLENNGSTEDDAAAEVNSRSGIDALHSENVRVVHEAWGAIMDEIEEKLPI